MQTHACVCRSVLTPHSHDANPSERLRVVLSEGLGEGLGQGLPGDQEEPLARMHSRNGTDQTTTTVPAGTTHVGIHVATAGVRRTDSVAWRRGAPVGRRQAPRRRETAGIKAIAVIALLHISRCSLAFSAAACQGIRPTPPHRCRALL